MHATNKTPTAYGRQQGKHYKVCCTQTPAADLIGLLQRRYAAKQKQRGVSALNLVLNYKTLVLF